MAHHQEHENIFDMIIIGSGVVGYGTAVYAGRFNMKTLIIGELPGGIITTTDIVENYPGFIRLSGIELAEKLKEHALDYKVGMENDKVTEVKKIPNSNCFQAMTSGGKKF